MYHKFLQGALMMILCTVVQVAVAQTDSLKITYDPTKSGDSCKPLGVAKMYVHSGAGTSSPSAGWEYGVGNWGIDDGIGQMIMAGPNLWTKTIHVYDYYSQAANGPIPPGETIYSIAMNFRNANASAIGKDKNCQDIYIRQVNTNNPVVQNSDGSPFSGVMAEWVNPIGIDAVEARATFECFPNPSRGQSKIRYSVDDPTRIHSLKVFSTLGEEIITLFQGPQTRGLHEIVWDGSNSVGEPLSSGVYLLVFNNDQFQQTMELVLTR